MTIPGLLAISKLRQDGGPDDCCKKQILMRDALLEFMATTLFVFSIVMTAMASGRALSTNGLEEDVARVFPIAWAAGVSILTMAYSVGHLTGGHFNPAVSLMMVLKRKLSWKKMLYYWVAQFVGAMLAAALAWGCVSGAEGETIPSSGGAVTRPPLNLGATTMDVILSTGNGFLCEFMGSFIFFFVIAQCATDQRGIAQSLFPAIPIGFSLVIVHCFLIPFTGCGVNPARTFGPSMIVCMAGTCDEVVQSSYWIYWIGPFLAAFAVAEVTEWMALDMDEDDDAKKEEGKEVGEEKPEEEVTHEA